MALALEVALIMAIVIGPLAALYYRCAMWRLEAEQGMHALYERRAIVMVRPAGGGMVAGGNLPISRVSLYDRHLVIGGIYPLMLSRDALRLRSKTVCLGASEISLEVTEPPLIIHVISQDGGKLAALLEHTPPAST